MTILIEQDKKIEEAIRKSQEYLFSKQHEEGYWAGLLEADVTVVTDFLILMLIFGIRNKKRELKAIEYVRKRQHGDGSWSLYYEGQGSLDITLRTYFFLKIAGIDTEEEIMVKARRFILEKGGAEKTNAYTKIILALFGQYSWKGIPEIPPEIIFLPKWSYVNIYEFASWTRATILAFSIIITAKPVFKIDNSDITELYKHKRHLKHPPRFRLSAKDGLANIFILTNYLFKLWDKLPGELKIGRNLATQRVKEWILDHQEEDGSWGGILLPWFFSLIALKVLGKKDDDPVISKGIEGLEDFIMEDEDSFILQPATSPVWDTAWSIIALRFSGVSPDDERLVKAARWLLRKQINAKGDWVIKNPSTQPGCWSFEFENKYYPDIDDTSKVSLALDLVDLPEKEKKDEAIDKAIKWVLDMQNRDGSWAAFDRDNNKKLFKNIPFADFITPLDFGTPDITGHVLFVIGELGYTDDIDKRFIAKALKNLKKNQCRDGSWYGRWGVTYIYGTSKVLQALDVLGRKEKLFYCFEKNIVKAFDWLKSIQNDDGGWGEHCASFEEHRYVELGGSTASQTAWALLGLMSCRENDECIRKGIGYLIENQNPDGSWSEKHYTGGGFPGTFYLRYELYKDYFPLMALGKYKRFKRIG